MKRRLRRQRKMTFGEKRRMAAKLRREGKNFSEIGAILAVSPIRARDLCLQHDRIAAASPVESYWMELSTKAIMALLCGAVAKRFGRTIEARYERLPEIAAAYCRADLLKEESVGPTTCDEVETWLASKGLSFQPDTLDIAKIFAQSKRPNAKQAARRRRAKRRRIHSIEMPPAPASYPGPGRSLH